MATEPVPFPILRSKTEARVFGTSLGHDKKTAGQECYQRLLANGLLWICGKP